MPTSELSFDTAIYTGWASDGGTPFPSNKLVATCGIHQSTPRRRTEGLHGDEVSEVISGLPEKLR